ncbi:hypothetical protein [Methanosarcina sp. 1.H.A.2.2]|uniref:hypothetical protein n=1 Tax=Methanosarcina sp. 1.H.A.2.2 TaxID=1483601 RepID=UPI000622B301|nr:hypothetical protein [Methanosarcina sp. 1.H.A.2.2]KKH48724.1 hypothetical protein EO93_14640 [Methanosarcina sp. 1.H.A.2.2]
MEEEQKNRIFIVLTILVAILVFGYSFYLSLDDEYVFGASVSDESVFEVYLTSNVEYKFLVAEIPYSGPGKIFVSISKDSYVPFEKTFRLDYLDGVYGPYHPDFTVEENGTYNIHVKPLDTGSFRVGIKEYS